MLPDPFDEVGCNPCVQGAVRWAGQYVEGGLFRHRGVLPNLCEQRCHRARPDVFYYPWIPAFAGMTVRGSTGLVFVVP